MREGASRPPNPSPLLFADSGEFPDEPWRWARPTRRAQCPTCEEVFSTDANFDRHLSRGRHDKGYAGPWCVHPTLAGLIADEQGAWKQPGAASTYVPETARGRSPSQRLMNGSDPSAVIRVEPAHPLTPDREVDG